MKRTCKYRLLAAAACFFVFPTIVVAGPTVGIPPFQSFGGGPDAINLGNLNVHYSFPIFNRAGRGIPFSYALAYNSSVWTAAGSTWLFSGSGGLTRDVSAAVGYVGASVVQHHCIDRYNGSTFYYNLYTYTGYNDSAGTWHYFGTLRVNDDDGTCTSGVPHSLTATATDGSGMTMTV